MSRAAEIRATHPGACGAENPEYPGEYACTFPVGHGRVPVIDGGEQDGTADHGAPEYGAWWSMANVLVPIDASARPMLVKVADVIDATFAEHTMGLVFATGIGRFNFVCTCTQRFRDATIDDHRAHVSKAAAYTLALRGLVGQPNSSSGAGL